MDAKGKYSMSEDSKTVAGYCATHCSERYKVAVIGSGAAAFAALVRLNESDADVTVIEAGTTGGTCVNVGCVPSKILISAAQVAHARTSSPFDSAISASPINVNQATLQAQVQGRVKEMRKTKYESIIENSSNIQLIRGEARFADDRTLLVKDTSGGEQRLSFDRALIATGASPVIPDVAGLSGTPYWTSTEALATRELPAHLIVLGSSYVALELAQAFLRLGSQVTMLARSTILSRHDRLIGETIQSILTDEGMRILTDRHIQQVRYDTGYFTLDTGRERIVGDRLLLATGRRPNTDRLSLENAGVATDGRDAIVVDRHMLTSNARIYAAGDCTSNPEHVYVAAAAGTRAAANILGGQEILDLSVTPAVIFTDPQIAIVGMDESTAFQESLHIETRVLNLDKVPRAVANFDTRGFIKVVADADSGRLLGVQVVGSQAGELIQTAALAIRTHMTVHELAGQLFPYLTMVEGLKLAAQAFTKEVTQLSCCAG